MSLPGKQKFVQIKWLCLCGCVSERARLSPLRLSHLYFCTSPNHFKKGEKNSNREISAEFWMETSFAFRLCCYVCLMFSAFLFPHPLTSIKATSSQNLFRQTQKSERKLSFVVVAVLKKMKRNSEASLLLLSWFFYSDVSKRFLLW